MGRFFTSIELAAWPKVSVVFLMVLFVGIAAWVFRPSGRRGYEDAARLPLEGE